MSSQADEGPDLLGAIHAAELAVSEGEMDRAEEALSAALGEARKQRATGGEQSA